MDSLKLTDQLCFPIYALSRQITTLYRPYLDKLGITYPQYLVMLVLWEYEEICVKNIGKLLWLDSGTLTPLLKRMEENGLIMRCRSKQDERHMFIYLSEEGRKMKENAYIIHRILKKELCMKEKEFLEYQKQFYKLLTIVTNKCKCKNKEELKDKYLKESKIDMELIKSLQWRYATKKFDPSKKVEQSLVDQIIEAAWLAPTSSGLQPFKVIEITNQELKKKMVSISKDQKQVEDCSHILVFAAWDNYTEKRIDTIYGHITGERNQPADAYKSYTDRIKGVYLNRAAELNFEHAAKQTYIAFGLSIAAAAELKVDTTPMEGFENEAIDELLNLKELGLKSVVMLPLGYRDEDNDWNVNYPKVRHPKKDFLIKIK